MSTKVDKLDLQILEHLDQNVRAGAKQIGQELKVQRQVVDYRMRRLETNGSIIGYRMLANLSKLGFQYYRLHIKLISCTKKEKTDFFNFLINHPKTVWIVECDGKYDGLVGINTLNSREWQDLLFTVQNKYAALFLYSDFVTPLEIIVPSRDFLGNKKLRNIKGAIVDHSFQEEISEIDKRIINELALDGRQTVLSLAQKINESPEKVNYHVKQILKKGLLFSNIQFGYPVLQYELYKTLLYLKNPDRQCIEELKKFARSYPRIWDIVETQGKWQLELDIESKGHDDYYHIMDSISEKFFDILLYYDTLFIRKEHKFLFRVFS